MYFFKQTNKETYFPMDNIPNNHDANARKTFLKENSCLFLNAL